MGSRGPRVERSGHREMGGGKQEIDSWEMRSRGTIVRRLEQGPRVRGRETGNQELGMGSRELRVER
jgi:hypothetical protein